MKRILICIIALAAITLQATAQEQEKKNEEGFLFTVIKENPITPVKNQSSTGTCWSFSSLGFMESELLRMGKSEYDLSEMFVVSRTYTDKADKYIRLDGALNFAQGGGFDDYLYGCANGWPDR